MVWSQWRWIHLRMRRSRWRWIHLQDGSPGTTPPCQGSPPPHHQSGAAGGPGQHPIAGPASAAGARRGAYPPQLTGPSISSGLVSLSFPSPTLSPTPPLLKGSHLFSELQEKGMRQHSFSQAAAPGEGPPRDTEVPGAWRWCFFGLRMRRLPNRRLSRSQR